MPQPEFGQSVSRVKPVVVVTGKHTIAATATVLTATSTELIAGEITLKAAVSNANACYIGSQVDVGGITVTTAIGFELRAGQQITLSIDNPTRLYVIGTAAETLTWIAS